MDVSGVSEAVEVLVGIDVSVADHAELASASQSVARLQSFVDLAKVQIARRTRQLRDEGDTASTHVLEDEGRLSGKEAAANDERDRVCDQLPEFEDALTNGECTAGHLDVLAHHTKHLSDVERADLELVMDDLLRDAANDPIALFERKVKAVVAKIREMHRPDSDVAELDRQREQSKVTRWTDRDTGMKHTLIALDPIRDAALWNVVDQHLARLRTQPGNDRRSFAELKVEALMEAILPGDRSGARVPEIVAHVDVGSLCHGRHPVGSITSNGSRSVARRCWRTWSRSASGITTWYTKAAGTSASTIGGCSPGHGPTAPTGPRAVPTGSFSRTELRAAPGSRRRSHRLPDRLPERQASRPTRRPPSHPRQPADNRRSPDRARPVAAGSVLGAKVQCLV